MKNKGYSLLLILMVVSALTLAYGLFRWLTDEPAVLPTAGIVKTPIYTGTSVTDDANFGVALPLATEPKRNVRVVTPKEQGSASATSSTAWQVHTQSAQRSWSVGSGAGDASATTAISATTESHTSSERQLAYAPVQVPKASSSSLRRRATAVDNSAPQPAIQPRRVYRPGDSVEDGKGNYYDEEDEEWKSIPGGTGDFLGGITEAGTFIGQTRQGTDGKWYYWNGTLWLENTLPEPTPLGNTPYLIVMAGLLLYALRKQRKQANI